MRLAARAKLPCRPHTQFAQPGEFSVVFDVVPEGGTGGRIITFGFGDTNDYIAIDVVDGMQGDTTDLAGCTIITVTVSES